MKVERLAEQFTADSKRVVLLPFEMNPDRTNRLLTKLMDLDEENVEALLASILNEFEDRHKAYKTKLIENYKKVFYNNEKQNISDKRKQLIGAYFSKEYSVEAAALFNPSIILHPDQSGMNEKELKFIMSLRATGEGHISSIEFREGIIDKKNNIKMVSPTRYTASPEYIRKKISLKELASFISESPILNELKGNLGEEFIYSELRTALQGDISQKCNEQTESILDYADSNYSAEFDADIPVSERVLFPYSKSESMGMEDVRFVRFINDDGSYKYYGTYTAYNGRSFRTQLIQTDDFVNFEIKTMAGNGVLDKGLALFPRRVNDMYYMISRQDGENLFIMKSDDLYRWENAVKLMTPLHDWEFVQIGNCGSPIETAYGWLLITHAVGAMRKYVISAILLDPDEPEKIIGRCDKPILSPDENEREGYVPNVVYSCGSLVKDNELIIPYAMSDSASGFAKVNINELVDEILK